MNDATENRPVRIEWQLLMMMGRRKIRTVTELRRRLGALGIEISSQQLCKIAAEMPDRLNTKLLAGLLTVLDCRIEELMLVEPRQGPPPPASTTEPATEGVPAKKKEPRRRPPRREAEPPVDKALGPKVSPFPLPPKKRPT